jgi:regulator of protease activity HflC (stomatin/prohibitin superfamily)
MGEMIGTAIFMFFLCLFGEMIILGIARMLCLYTVVQERQCHVYVLWGSVVGILDEPGLYILPAKYGWMPTLFFWMVQRYELDMRMDQEYHRSLPVNSEEGAPMGVGVWYEMYISDPVAFLFKNTDPRGSLGANVSSSAVRCLSNMKLGELLENRHGLSQTVRTEVSARSREWGYKTGSVYIRKVHFRDHEMIKQIESKVVNRLRQVTSAIRQDGTNQVSIISSTAERQAAIEFAKAAAVKPQIVGQALAKIGADEELAEVLYTILDYERLRGCEGKVTLIPENPGVLSQLLAAEAADVPDTRPRRELAEAAAGGAPAPQAQAPQRGEVPVPRGRRRG